MTDKQKDFCKDFIALMKKYNISNVYIDYRSIISFVSNDEEFNIDGYGRREGVEVFEDYHYFYFEG